MTVFLLKAASAPSVQTNLRSIEGCVGFLLTQQFPSGNLPSSLESQTDKLIHWCHGAPGAIHLMVKAYQVLKGCMHHKFSHQPGEVVNLQWQEIYPMMLGRLKEVCLSVIKFLHFGGVLRCNNSQLLHIQYILQTHKTSPLCQPEFANKPPPPQKKNNNNNNDNRCPLVAWIVTEIVWILLVYPFSLFQYSMVKLYAHYIHTIQYVLCLPPLPNEAFCLISIHHHGLLRQTTMLLIYFPTGLSEGEIPECCIEVWWSDLAEGNLEEGLWNLSWGIWECLCLLDSIQTNGKPKVLAPSYEGTVQPVGFFKSVLMCASCLAENSIKSCGNSEQVELSVCGR